MSQMPRVAREPSIMHLLSQRRWRIQADQYKQVGPFVMCDLDPGSWVEQQRLYGTDRQY